MAEMAAQAPDFYSTAGGGGGDSPAVLAVRVHTLPAGLVPQLDSLVITGGHDEPPVGGEPESGKARHTTG